MRGMQKTSPKTQYHAMQFMYLPSSLALLPICGVPSQRNLSYLPLMCKAAQVCGAPCFTAAAAAQQDRVMHGDGAQYINK